MKKIARLILLPLVMSLPGIASGQDQVEMADAMRSDGKIYVVVAIIMVIFVGLIIYLATMDRKITRIERRLIEKKS